VANYVRRRSSNTRKQRQSVRKTRSTKNVDSVYGVANTRRSKVRKQFRESIRKRNQQGTLSETSLKAMSRRNSTDKTGWVQTRGTTSKGWNIFRWDGQEDAPMAWIECWGDGTGGWSSECEQYSAYDPGYQAPGFDHPYGTQPGSSTIIACPPCTGDMMITT